MGSNVDVNSKGQRKIRRSGISRPDLPEVLRDSPTLSAQAEAPFLQRVVSRRVNLVSGDIKTAFLSGGEETSAFFLLKTYVTC